MKPAVKEKDVYKKDGKWRFGGDNTEITFCVSESVRKDNKPPKKPVTPKGKAKGKPGQPYEYTSSTTDPEGDQISYQFDWGDGTTSEWSDPIPSGAEISMSHTWSGEGDYNVKVKAKDTLDAESEWSENLKVSMPKSKAVTSPYLRLLFQYPLLNKILRVLGL